MENEEILHQSISDVMIDQYLQGNLSEQEELAFCELIATSREVSALVIARASMAERLASITPAAHGEAYRRELVEKAVTQLAGQGAKIEMRERLMKWAEELAEIVFPVKPVLEFARGGPALTTDARVVLAPSQPGVQVSIQGFALQILLQGWPSAPLVVVVNYAESAHPLLFTAEDEVPTAEGLTFAVTLKNLADGQYLIAAEPLG